RAAAARPGPDRRDGCAHDDRGRARRRRPHGRPHRSRGIPKVGSPDMIKPDLAMPLPDQLGSVHFTGIGGSGMSGIARLFLAAGHRVSGSDRAENHNTEELRGLGATVTIGHDARNLGDAEALVYTGALWPDNPEYLAAVERGIP